jgi:hypothetical protein
MKFQRFYYFLLQQCWLWLQARFGFYMRAGQKRANNKGPGRGRPNAQQPARAAMATQS